MKKPRIIYVSCGNQNGLSKKSIYKKMIISDKNEKGDFEYANIINNLSQLVGDNIIYAYNYILIVTLCRLLQTI